MNNSTKYIAKQVILFISICFSVSLMIKTVIKFTETDLPINESLVLIPGLTVIGLYLLKFRMPVIKDSDLGLNLQGFRYWIIAPLVIFLFGSLSYGLSLIMEPDLLKDKTCIHNYLLENSFPDKNISLGIVTVILINLSLGNLLQLPLYIGEELGWRAFLQTRLLKITNPVVSFLAGGICWALWHFLITPATIPAIAGNLPRFALTFMFFIPLGIILQYFYFKSKSILVPAITHGALDILIRDSSLFITGSETDILYYGPKGWIGILLSWILAVYLFKRMEDQGYFLTTKI